MGAFSSRAGRPYRREQASAERSFVNQQEVGNRRGQVVPITMGQTRSLLISITDGLADADPNEPLLRLELLQALGIGDVVATAGDAATGTPAFRFFKDGVANGTVTFTGSTGVAADIDDYPADSLLEVYPPVSPDATLDDVSISVQVTI